MLKIKMRYMEIPENNLKPLSYFYNKSYPGEVVNLQSQKDVVSLIKEKNVLGWKFIFKEEHSDIEYTFYFYRTKKEN